MTDPNYFPPTAIDNLRQMRIRFCKCTHVEGAHWDADEVEQSRQVGHIVRGGRQAKVTERQGEWASVAVQCDCTEFEEQGRFARLLRRLR
jgi:hypothetical protein